MPQPVGLLTLQGDYEKHRQVLARLGRETVAVRRPAELDAVAALVIPGGESTTLSRLIEAGGLRHPGRETTTKPPTTTRASSPAFARATG